jgi:hypothetical protein
MSDFPFKVNSGTKKADLDRGFSTDEPEPEDIFPMWMDDTEGMPFPNGGFLGRAKGWER